MQELHNALGPSLSLRAVYNNKKKTCREKNNNIEIFALSLAPAYCTQRKVTLSSLWQDPGKFWVYKTLQEHDFTVVQCLLQDFGYLAFYRISLEAAWCHPLQYGRQGMVCIFTNIVFYYFTAAICDVEGDLTYCRWVKERWMGYRRSPPQQETDGQ